MFPVALLCEEMKRSTFLRQTEKEKNIVEILWAYPLVIQWINTVIMHH